MGSLSKGCRRVDFTAGHGELEPIGIVRDHLFDDVGAKPFVIKFLRQS